MSDLVSYRIRQSGLAETWRVERKVRRHKFHFWPVDHWVVEYIGSTFAGAERYLAMRMGVQTDGGAQ